MSNEINGIKIWNLDDCEWYAGRSLEEVSAFYKNQCGVDPDPDYVQELTGADLDRLKFAVDEPRRIPADQKFITFREQLQNMVNAGEAFPNYFATTEY
jgi:hypothetical protein